MTGRHRSADRGATHPTDARFQRILAVVDSVPRGQVASYGQVAREALLPGRARLVGRVLRQVAAASRLPWHRVVRADGSIASHGDGATMTERRRRLAREGVRFDARGRIDLERYGWRG